MDIMMPIDIMNAEIIILADINREYSHEKWHIEINLLYCEVMYLENHQYFKNVVGLWFIKWVWTRHFSLCYRPYKPQPITWYTWMSKLIGMEFPCYSNPWDQNRTPIQMIVSLATIERLSNFQPTMMLSESCK